MQNMIYGRLVKNFESSAAHANIGWLCSVTHSGSENHPPENRGNLPTQISDDTQNIFLANLLPSKPKL